MTTNGTAKQSDLTGRKMETREQVIKWLNDNGHAKVTSKIIPLDNGNFRPVVDVIMGCLEQVKSVDLADVVCSSCGSSNKKWDRYEITLNDKDGTDVDVSVDYCEDCGHVFKMNEY